MKIRELVDQLRKIESEHPDAEIRFQTLETKGITVTYNTVEVFGIDYGKDGSDYCMVSLAEARYIESLRRLLNTA